MHYKFPFFSYWILISATFDLSGEVKSSDWIVVEDDFISVYCLALPWVGTTLLMAPQSQLSDGVLYLVRNNVAILRKLILMV